ncbi:MAG TPA: D-aminoacyl-tRNA deacylase [Candidatus Aquilonibacter sp.]|nr:D-aminoacyl-tRNA deacylase [Candidatus Aquilonibacter sp.]
MIGIISSTLDATSNNMAERLLENPEFEPHKINGKDGFRNGKLFLLRLSSPLIGAEIDSFGFEVAYFLSKHKSANNVPALTTHSLGNWTGEAKIGGKPFELSFAAPLEMLGMLRGISRIDAQIEKTYEATHHGPLLKTPSLFVELGGDDATIQNRELAHRLADSVYSSITNEVEYQKCVVGVGSTHYPEKFTALALEKGYAFSHIMPKHAILNEDGTDNLQMLEQALTRSKNPPELAVVDWKSINAEIKNRVLGELNRIGLDHEKV